MISSSRQVQNPWYSTILRHKLLIILVCCAVLVWLSGPTGRFLVVLPVLLFFPGYLVERVIPVAMPQSMWVRPVVWMGLSISLIALLYQWMTFFGLAISLPVLVILFAAVVAGGICCLWYDLNAIHENATGKARWHMWVWWSLFFIVFGITIWLRFLHIKDLVLPAWVDPVHHTLMVRVAVEQGKVPFSLRPYLPVDYLPYHWGYHVFTATVVRLCGINIPRVMLWEGQILNALHCLSCAALANYVWRRPWSGIVAAIVVGIISIMPAYYVSWGRYTQLTGLLLLPALAMVWDRLLRFPSRNAALLAIILLAGLCMVHFLVLLLTLCLLAAITCVWLIERGWDDIRSRIGYVAVSGFVSLILTLPWLRVLLNRIVVPAVEKPKKILTGGDYSALHEGLLWAGTNRLLVALALVGLFLALWRRSRLALVFPLWVGVLMIAANPSLLRSVLPAIGAFIVVWAFEKRRFVWLAGGIALSLAVLLYRGTIPQTWLITNDVVIISLFLPLSVLIGGGFHVLLSFFHRLRTVWLRWLLQGSFILGVVVWMVHGAWNFQGVVNTSTILVYPPDVRALDWIQEHTPADARFLINSAFWYSGTDRGVDGGYWIMPYTGRWTSTPPAMFIHGDREYVAEVRAVSGFVRDFQPDKQQQLFELIKEQAITHIYLGPNEGPLKRALFDGNESFQLIYEDKGVTIYKVRTS